jgi:hypothetical protein
MKSRAVLHIAFIASYCFTNNHINAQKDEKISPFKVKADLVSTYVWRGSLATGSQTPNFQPALAYINGKLEIGIWGSTDFIGSYKELDPYIFFSADKIKFGFTDYYWNFSRADYFNYENSETCHRFEGTIGFTGTETIPVSLTWNSMIYGFDKDPDDSTKQAYSTYIELGYTRGIASFFFGFTPWAGYYNNYGATSFDTGAAEKAFSIVNIGASVSKALKISESYYLPVRATLIVNPSATYSRNDFVHLIIVITF